MLVRIDKVVKGSEEFDALIDQEVATTGSDTTDTTKVQQERVVDSKEVSLTELFGETAVDDTTEEDTSSVLVDEQLFQERPFSSLLLRLQNDLGVQAQNVFAVKKILEMEEVKSILKTGDSRIAWSTERETWSTADGEQESFFRLYHLEASAGLTGGVIQEAIEDLYNGQPIVRLNMNSEGAKTWSRLTGANVGKRVAIVLDKNVHMAPAIRTKITDGRTQVEGFANMAEAKDIAIVLRAGALPAPVDIIEERTVGPSLGKDSITMGTHSILIGLALVLVFMVIYYRLSGIIAAFCPSVESYYLSSPFSPC